MKRLSLCAAAALVFGCSHRADSPAPEPTSASVVRLQERRAYEGVLPCADCAGIHTLLVLDPNTSLYQLVETYLGTEQPDSVFRTKGEWSTVRGSASDPTALVYELDPRRSTGLRHFVRVSENEIRQLDHEQRDIDSRLPYSLRRVPVPEDMAARRTITLADSGRTIRLHPGEELTIRLPSDRSAGYGWIRADSAKAPLVHVAGPRYEAPAAARPGASGSESFAFRAQGAGRDTLTLEYRRPGEQDEAPARTFRIRIRVR